MGGFNAEEQTPQIGCAVASVLEYNVNWARIVIERGERMITRWLGIGTETHARYRTGGFFRRRGQR